MVQQSELFRSVFEKSENLLHLLSHLRSFEIYLIFLLLLLIIAFSAFFEDFFKLNFLIFVLGY